MDSGATLEELEQRPDYDVQLESLNQWQLAWRRFKRHKLAMASAIILLLLGLSVFTRHRIASYVVGGFIMVLAALSILAFLKILNVQGGPINIG